MKTRVLLTTVVIGLAAIFLATGIYAGTKVPDVIKLQSKEYEKHKKGIVEFTHTKHAVDYAKASPDLYKDGCGACHQIPGVSEGIVGPSLSNIGAVAETREEGVSAAEYLRESIYAPNAYLVEGYNEGLMPQNFQELISEPELEDLIAYLVSLQ
jgi:mono/diheme cytochrome c family protein